jgi:guanylate kinase
MTHPAPRLLILYGPPASGKSTITTALESRNHRFRLFPRLKYGEGRRSEYRMTSREELERLRAGGEVVWENQRYGAVYVTDRGHIMSMLADGLIPVLHAGQPEMIDAVAKAFPDVGRTCVSLTCPRPIAVARIGERATDDTSERVTAYDSTPPLPGADLIIDTSTTPVHDAARSIARACLGEEGSA